MRPTDEALRCPAGHPTEEGDGTRLTCGCLALTATAEALAAGGYAERPGPMLEVDLPAMMPWQQRIMERLTADVVEVSSTAPDPEPMTATRLAELVELLRPRRVIVCHAEDEGVVVEAVERLRADGFRVDVTTNDYVRPGAVFVLDADWRPPMARWRP